jgi:hypothetical protein
VRAIAVTAIFGLEPLPAALTGADVGLPSILSSAVGIESRRAIRTHDLQVLQPVVIWNAVDVVENQRHRPAPPVFVLAAPLAAPHLEALREEALLQLAS